MRVGAYPKAAGDDVSLRRINGGFCGRMHGPRCAAISGVTGRTADISALCQGAAILSANRAFRTEFEILLALR
jgi:hypothetical protein